MDEVGISDSHCNFIYSLLGIETKSLHEAMIHSQKLQFHLLPIRDWNVPPVFL